MQCLPTCSNFHAILPRRRSSSGNHVFQNASISMQFHLNEALLPTSPLLPHINAKNFVNFQIIWLFEMGICKALHLRMYLTPKFSPTGNGYASTMEISVCLWGLFESPWLGIPAESSSDRFRLPNLWPPWVAADLSCQNGFTRGGARLKALPSYCPPFFWLEMLQCGNIPI